MKVATKDLQWKKGMCVRVTVTKQTGKEIPGAGTTSTIVFPRHIILESISNYGGGNGGLWGLNYFDGSKRKCVYISSKKTFTIEDNEELIEKYKNEQATADFANNLRHSCNIGADPEMFAEDEAGNVIPAFTFLGSKADSNVFANSQRVYWDGFQAEFNTTAGTCLDGQVGNYFQGLQAILTAALKINPKARLSSKTVVEVSAELLEKSEERFVQFGCSPSLNAYGLEGLGTDGRTVPFRPAGGHMHFGIGTHTEKQAVPIVKALDAVVGVACVSMFAKFDDPRRRSLYGLAGEFRLPHHGLEYRTLSNAWLFHPLIAYMSFDLARKAMMLGKNNLLHLWKAEEKETIDTIQNCDVKQARIILERNKALMIRILEAIRGGYENHGLTAFNAWMAGMENVVVDPTNIAGNWQLSGYSTGKATPRFYESRATMAAGKKVA